MTVESAAYSLSAGSAYDTRLEMGFDRLWFKERLCIKEIICNAVLP